MTTFGTCWWFYRVNFNSLKQSTNTIFLKTKWEISYEIFFANYNFAESIKFLVN